VQQQLQTQELAKCPGASKLCWFICKLLLGIYNHGADSPSPGSLTGSRTLPTTLSLFERYLHVLMMFQAASTQFTSYEGTLKELVGTSTKKKKKKPDDAEELSLMDKLSSSLISSIAGQTCESLTKITSDMFQRLSLEIAQARQQRSTEISVGTVHIDHLDGTLNISRINNLAVSNCEVLSSSHIS
jgi:hypothetical protein